ncbi:hypothetical protein [Mesorhizobium loti]|nr:hypothetical protein [Mesorhizobium loti]
MADAQAGIGPFLGVFLLAHGWASGGIGMVMTIGGVAGMLMITPAGLEGKHSGPCVFAKFANIRVAGSPPFPSASPPARLPAPPGRAGRIVGPATAASACRAL